MERDALDLLHLNDGLRPPAPIVLFAPAGTRVQLRVCAGVVASLRASPPRVRRAPVLLLRWAFAAARRLTDWLFPSDPFSPNSRLPVQPLKNESGSGFTSGAAGGGGGGGGGGGAAFSGTTAIAVTVSFASVSCPSTGW